MAMLSGDQAELQRPAKSISTWQSHSRDILAIRNPIRTCIPVAERTKRRVISIHQTLFAYLSTVCAASIPGVLDPGAPTVDGEL